MSSPTRIALPWSSVSLGQPSSCRGASMAVAGSSRYLLTASRSRLAFRCGRAKYRATATASRPTPPMMYHLSFTEHPQYLGIPSRAPVPECHFSTLPSSLRGDKSRRRAHISSVGASVKRPRPHDHPSVARPPVAARLRGSLLQMPALERSRPRDHLRDGSPTRHTIAGVPVHGSGWATRSRRKRRGREAAPAPGGLPGGECPPWLWGRLARCYGSPLPGLGTGMARPGRPGRMRFARVR